VLWPHTVAERRLGGGRPGSDICPLSRSHPRHRGPGEGVHERGGAGVQHRWSCQGGAGWGAL